MRKYLILVAFVLQTSPSLLHAEPPMELDTGETCLGHFTMRIDPSLKLHFEETNALFDLGQIKRLDVDTHESFQDFLQSQSSSLVAQDRSREPIITDIPNGRILGVRETARGGTMHSFVFHEGAGFEIQSGFTDRIIDQFLDVAVDVAARVRPATEKLSTNAIFCFADGFVVGPIVTPNRTKGYAALFGAQGGIRLSIETTWLAEPKVGFTADITRPWMTRRSVGGTSGIEARLNAGESAGDNGFTAFPATGGQRYYEGVTNDAPGIRLQLRLWNDSKTALSGTEIDAIWEELLASVTPLPALELQ